MWYHVTMVAKFLNHTNRELKKRRQQQERQTSKTGLQCVYKQNNNFAWRHAFLYYIFCMFLYVFFLYCIIIFLSHHCATAPWNFIISHARLWSWWTQHKMFLFLFLNLDTVLLYSNPTNFATIWQIKWNWMRSMKFETVQIHFLSDVLSLLSSRNLLPRQCDEATSPLYCHERDQLPWICF